MTMSMLLFMPWCPIDKAYELSGIRILPYRRGAALEGLDQPQQSRVDAIMGMYKTIEGKPIHSAAILCFAGKAPIDELSEAEKEQAFDEFTDLACFSGLATRDYFESARSYCNRDCFMLYGQEFGPADVGALSWRQRQGRFFSTWRMNGITFSVPMHCYTVHEVTIDANLLEALGSHQAQSAPKEWDRWRSSISCFNQANTDSDNIRLQVELVLMVGAFQELLNVGDNAKAKAKEVARRFSEVVAPYTSLATLTSGRGSTRWPSSQEPLRYEWMREFHRIRNDFAHGKSRNVQTPVWNPLEHMVLGAIAFPLLVKCLLSEAGRYSLTRIDRRDIDCFEKLADTKDFLDPPAYSESSLDTHTHWTRLCQDWNYQEARRNVADAFDELEARLAQGHDASQAASDAADEE